MPPTTQQTTVINHDHSQHGRVVAGPGTGKSWTAIELLRRVHDADPGVGLGLLTFTRAATGELLKKVGDQGLDWLSPATIHSYALRLLMRGGPASALALPLRIPDTWETKTLIRRHLARRLRGAGHDVDTRKVALLEREMSAQWEALDPDLVLLGAVDPTLRNAYVGQWQAHRAVFGYVLLAEIPFRACNYIEDFAPDLQGLRFLVVDEYQDLNRADIKLLQLMAEQGVKLLAIGDDDQSIYGFRMAAPEGIAEFPATFRTANDYPLTVSMRCGGNVLEAATSLIETAPARVRRPRLSPVAGAPPGTFAYLRFPNQRREAVGVADLVARRIRDGVSAKDIAILVRSSVDSWAALLIPELQARGIDVVDTDWVARGMQDPSLRRALAVARIAVERSDSLAWWTLLHLTRGIAEEFIEQIATQCGRGETFGSCLLRTAPTFGGLGSRQSVGTAAKLIREQLTAVEALDIAGTPTAPGGWGTWLANRVVHGALSDDASRLLKLVGAAVPAEDGLASFLGQLEPVGKDVALQADAVRIMSMSSSKGLTVNSAFVMGVEAGIMPHPTADPHEERRLLYVAMTRATTNCVLTAAARRTGPTARHGTPNVNQPRGRCPLFDGIIGSGWQSGEDFVTSALSAGDN